MREPENIKVFLILVFLCFLYAIYSNKSEFLKPIKSEFESSLDYESIFNKKKMSNCNPIKNNVTQYYAEIDGQIYPKYVLLHQNKSINFDCFNNQKISTTKTILVWNNWWGTRNYKIESSINEFERNNCPVTNCNIINNKSKINQSDLVIVSATDSFISPPKHRPPNQKWVLTWHESPSFKDIPTTKFENIFNWTTTYHIKSDFPGFYSSQSNMLWKKNDEFDENYDFSAEKIDLAAAVISNNRKNHVTSNRMLYINELQKFIKVDIYGKLGLPCPSNFRNQNKSLTILNDNKNPHDGLCKQIIYQEYKFYLAFENSICEEYITEKFFLPLAHPIVPVVLGGGPYDYYVPKSGYINAFDFATPKDLADYLTYLDKNSTAYNEYFKWKKHVVFNESIGVGSMVCDICIKLHLEDYFRYENSKIDNFNIFDRKNCKTPIPNIHTFFNLIDI